MLYLNDAQVRLIGSDWTAITNTVERAVHVMDTGDFAQPIKPYLRYGDPQNRIIAMPAYVGGEFFSAGIKWIASFPGNLERGLPRAHAVIVLNRADTGEPWAMLNGGRPSILRTAAVSGLMIRKFLEARPSERLKIGIIGMGPIGRAHLEMCGSLFGSNLERFFLYDAAGIPDEAVPEEWRDRTTFAKAWTEAYEDCDICITCTVSDRRYIDRAPAAGLLLLDVSLRDYFAEALRDVKVIVVDEWDEVCRENTDIELLHRHRGLLKEHTRSLADVVVRGALREHPAAEPVLFCPMGMAVFDVAVAGYLAAEARRLGLGLEL